MDLGWFGLVGTKKATDATACRMSKPSACPTFTLVQRHCLERSCQVWVVPTSSQPHIERAWPPGLCWHIPSLQLSGAGSPLGSKTYGNHRPFTWQSISLASAIWAGGQSSATIHDPTTKGLNQPQPLAAPYSLYSKFVFCSKNQGIIGTKIHETCWMPHLWPTMSTTSKVWIVTTSIFRYFPGPISGHFRSCGKNTPPQKSPNHHFCRRYVYHSQPFLW